MRKAAPYILLAILFAGAGWYAIVREPAPVEEAAVTLIPPEAPPRPTQLPERVPVAPEGEIIREIPAEPVEVPDPLQPLNESDPQFSESLTGAFGSETVDQYLVKGEIISRLVTMIDALTSRQVPPLINPVKAADDELIVDSDGDQLLLSPDNFARYDGYVRVLQNTDSMQVLNIYQRYQPLFQQAWEDNGGEGSFNLRLIEVIDELLDTPDVPGPVYLSKSEAIYVFDDPELESMTAGQKVLVRMGSANAELVKQKLFELRAGLDGNLDTELEAD